MNKILVCTLVLWAGTATSFAGDPVTPADGLWQQWLLEGREAMRQHDSAAAVSAFEMAVHRAESFIADDPRLAESLTWLGRAHQQDRQLNDALPPMLRSLELRRSLPGFGSPESARAIGEVARLFAGIGELGEAVTLQRESIELREASLGPEHVDLISPLEQLATWLTNLDRVEAETALLRALRISESSHGPDHREIGRLLARLGELHARAQPPGEEAATYFRRALQLEARREDSNPETIIYRRQRLIQQLNRLRRYDESVVEYRINLAALRAHKGELHHEVASTLHGLATTLRAIDDLETAEQALRESLAISEHAWGHDHRVTEHVRNQLIAIVEQLHGSHGLGERRDLGLDPPMPPMEEPDREHVAEIDRRTAEDDLEGAIEVAEHWLDSARARYGAQSLQVTHPLGRLSGLLERRSLLDDAILYDDETLAILRLHVEQADPRHLGALNRLGGLHARAGSSVEALRYYETELSIRLYQGESSPRVARLLDRMGVTARQQHPALGEEYFDHAADMWERTVGRDAPERFVSRLMLAACFIAQGNENEAEPLLTDLLAQAEAAESASFSEIAVLQYLRTVYRTAGRTDEAAAMDARLARSRHNEPLLPAGQPGG